MVAYAEEIRKKLNTGEGIIKAVIYARVSTDNDSQKESCDNQVALAKQFINQHSNIRLQKVYIDDGLSGKNDFNRPQYNEMLRALRKEHFDLIITKAFSRLNRDQFNSLALKAILIDYNATVYTLEDGQLVNFEDMNTELLQSLKYAIDALYVKQQSLNARKTQELRIEQKKLSAKDISFGYSWDKNTKSIRINEEEADTIRWIYDEYVFHNGTPSSIYRQLHLKGFRLCERSVVNLLKNEKYIGFFYINKKTTKLGTGQKESKRINIPREQWILCERPDLQIIDDDIFRQAQLICIKRAEWFSSGKETGIAVQARFQGRHNYSHIIFCAVCGKAFQFVKSQDREQTPTYRIKRHSECISPLNTVAEQDISEITKAALRKLIAKQEAVFTSLEQALSESIKEYQSSSVNMVSKLKKQKSVREAQIDALIDTLSEGGLNELSKERIKQKLNSLMKEVNELAEGIASQSNSDADNTMDKSALLNRIHSAIEDLKNFNIITREKVLNYLERIEVHPNGDIDITLKSGQRFTGRSAEDVTEILPNRTPVKLRNTVVRYS